MKDIKEIGKIFEHARKEKGLSIDVVSKKTHIHPKVLTCLENGTIEKELNQNKVYIKSFIKKYASFLGLDADKIIKEYAFLKVISPGDSPELYIKPKKAPMMDFKQLIPVAGLVLSLLVVVFLFMGIIKFKNFVVKVTAKKSQAAAIRKNQPVKTAVKREIRKKEPPKAVKEAVKDEVKSQVEPTEVEAVKSTTENKTPAQESPAPAVQSKKSGSFKLALRCRSNVWLRIDKDGVSVFKGVLNKNSRESWQAEKEIKIHVGKLEALDFTVDGKRIGKVGSGFQDVIITKNEIKVGDKKIPL